MLPGKYSTVSEYSEQRNHCGVTATLYVSIENINKIERKIIYLFVASLLVVMVSHKYAHKHTLTFFANVENVHNEFDPNPLVITYLF